MSEMMEGLAEAEKVGVKKSKLLRILRLWIAARDGLSPGVGRVPLHLDNVRTLVDAAGHTDAKSIAIVAKATKNIEVQTPALFQRVTEIQEGLEHFQKLYSEGEYSRARAALHRVDSAVVSNLLYMMSDMRENLMTLEVMDHLSGQD